MLATTHWLYVTNTVMIRRSCYILTFSQTLYATVFFRAHWLSLDFHNEMVMLWLKSLTMDKKKALPTRENHMARSTPHAIYPLCMRLVYRLVDPMAPHEESNTLHCLIEDTCLLFSRTAFLLDAFLLHPGWALERPACLLLHPGFWLVAAFC